MKPEFHPYSSDEYFCKTVRGYQSYIQFDAAEDIIGDRQTEVELCLKKGTFDIHFGWYDVKYRSFVWNKQPFGLELAVERSCNLQSFPISTRGHYVKDSRIQVLTESMREFLDEARESGEEQVQKCPTSESS